MKSLRYGQELRVGSSGVPLSVAPDLHRRAIVNREPPRAVWKDLELSPEVGKKLTALLRRHGCPSRERLIALSLGYPERTHAEIAAAFRCTVDHVADCAHRIASIRRVEPLSTELWEDMDEADILPDEVARRAAEVRAQRSDDGLDQTEIPGSSGQGSQGRAGVGGSTAWRRACPGAWREARLAKPQPTCGLLPHAGRTGHGAVGDQGPRPGVHQP